MGKYLVVLAALFLVSCGREQNTEKIDDETKAKVLLNEGKTDEAIRFLKKKQDQEPKNEEWSFLLATAYGIKGGIDVYSLFPILELKIFNKPATRWHELRKQDNPYSGYIKKNYYSLFSEENPDDPRNQGVTSLLQIVWGVYSWSSLLSLVPHLSDDQREYVDHAIGTLLKNSFPKVRKQDMFLYLALLNAIQFINILKDWVPEESKDIESIVCNLNLEPIRETLPDLQYYGNLFLVATNYAELLETREVRKYLSLMQNLSQKLNSSEFDSEHTLFLNLKKDICVERG